MENELLLATADSLKDDDSLIETSNGSLHSPPKKTRTLETSNVHLETSLSLKNLNDTASFSHVEHRQLLCKSLEKIHNKSEINQKLLGDKYMSRSSSFVSEMKDLSIEICDSKPDETNPKNSSPNTRIFSTNRLDTSFFSFICLFINYIIIQ